MKSVRKVGTRFLQTGLMAVKRPSDSRSDCPVAQLGTHGRAGRIAMQWLIWRKRPTIVFSVFAIIVMGWAAVVPGWCESGSTSVPISGTGSAHSRPERIVSLAPSVTEIIFALGEERRLVGVTELCDFPDEARGLPKIGAFLHPDIERIVSLDPDLCIAVKDANVPAGTEPLRSFGIPVVVLNPKSLDSVVETIREMGRLLGARERAEDLAAQMERRIREVKSRVAKTHERPGVFFQIGVSPIVSAGSGTFINELIEAAAGRNLAEGPIPYPRFSIEQVLTLQPDLILVTSMSRGTAFGPILDGWKQWPNVPAVRNGRIFLVDSNLFDRPTARLVQGLEILAEFIHPELY